MALQKSILALTILGGGLLLLGGSFIDAAWKKSRGLDRIQASAQLVRQLELTDLVLFTEARYTRNLSLADRFSAFQDHPMAFEHFPSGSVVPPPKHLRQTP